METQLNLIARGEADYQKVLGDVIKLFKKKYQFFTKNIEDMDSLFEVSFTPLADSGKALSRLVIEHSQISRYTSSRLRCSFCLTCRCGKCRRYMKYIQAKPNRLHCSQCNETYNLPQNGNIRIFKVSLTSTYVDETPTYWLSFVSIFVSGTSMSCRRLRITNMVVRFER